MGSLCLNPNIVFMFVFFSLFHSECLVQGQIQGYPAPKRCSTSGCPPYQIVHTQPEFEIRTYQNGAWGASPIITASSYENGTRDGLFDLLDFAMGTNHEGIEWNLTAPVSVDILPNSKFQVFSYIPKDLQKKPPTPFDDTGISLVYLPRKKFVAIKRFGGTIRDGLIVEQLASLKKSLKGTQWQSASASIDYSAAAFNPPWEETDRVNEIMLWFN